jgi:hypothetical protein
VPEGEPLLWQLSFSDAEISKIIQNRERSMFKRINQEEKVARIQIYEFSIVNYQI